MSLLGVVRYFNGYLDISVKGDCAEQFINICTKNKITVWRIRKKLGNLTLRILVSDYKNIRKLRKDLKLKLKIRIIKKHGIRFKIYKYRKRKGIAVGLIFFFVFLIFMSNFIWTIEIKGNDKISKNEIISVCRELHVYEGIYKRNIDTYDLPLKLILNLNGIAWSSFNIEGSKLTVEISEAKESEKENLKAANLIAKRDGVIEKMEITDGVKQVKTGQAVRKGDILASGIIDNGIRTYAIVASGKVTAKTERFFQFKIQETIDKEVLTGKSESRSVINFFGIKVPLYLGEIRFTSKDLLYEKNLKMFGASLPIGISTKTFSEVEISTEKIDKEKARNMALEMLSLEAKKLNVFSMKIKNFTLELKGNVYICSIVTECIEDISEKREINIDNELKNNR